MWRLVVLFALLPGFALAQGFKHREKSPDAPPLPKIEYFCTDADGERREIGEVICITASCLTWLARCDMSLNNPMWRKIQDGCPGVSFFELFQGLDPAEHPGPVHPQIPPAKS